MEYAGIPADPVEATIYTQALSDLLRTKKPGIRALLSSEDGLPSNVIWCVMACSMPKMSKITRRNRQLHDSALPQGTDLQDVDWLDLLVDGSTPLSSSAALTPFKERVLGEDTGRTCRSACSESLLLQIGAICDAFGGSVAGFGSCGTPLTNSPSCVCRPL